MESKQKSRVHDLQTQHSHVIYTKVISIWASFSKNYIALTQFAGIFAQ